MGRDGRKGREAYTQLKVANNIIIDINSDNNTCYRTHLATKFNTLLPLLLTNCSLAHLHCLQPNFSINSIGFLLNGEYGLNWPL